MPDKYVIGWKLYVNYGQGWEYEYFAATKSDYKRKCRELRDYSMFPHKWEKAKDLNPAWFDARELVSC